MQNVQVFCPHCSQVVQATAPYKDVICPYCNQVIFFHEDEKEKLMCECGKKMSVAPKYANRTASCPRCGADIFIPKFQITNTSSRKDLLDSFSNSVIASDNMQTMKLAVNREEMASLAKVGLSSTDVTMTSDIGMQPSYLPEMQDRAFATEEFKLDFGDQKEDSFLPSSTQENEEEQHELMLQEEEDVLNNFAKGNIVSSYGQSPYYDLVSCSPIMYNSESNNKIYAKNIMDVKSWPFMIKLACIVLISAIIIYFFQKKSQSEYKNTSPLFTNQFNYHSSHSQQELYKQLSNLPNFSSLPGKYRVQDKSTTYIYSIDENKNIRIIKHYPIISSDLIPEYDNTEGFHTITQDRIVYEYEVNEFGDIVQYQKFPEEALINSEDIPNFSNSKGLHVLTIKKNNMKYEYFINDYGRIISYIKSNLNAGLSITLFGTIDIPEQETEPGYYTTEDEKFSYSYWIDENHKLLSCQAIQIDLEEPEEDSFEEYKNKAKEKPISPLAKSVQGIIARSEEETRATLEEIDSCLEILEHYETYYEINLFFPKEMKQVNASKEEYNKKREEYNQKKQFFQDRENITKDEVQNLSKQFSRYKSELEDLKDTLNNIQLTIEASPIVTALIEIENTSNKEEKIARWFWLVKYNSIVQNKLKKLWKFSSKKGSYPQEKLHNQMNTITEDNASKSLYEELSLECFKEWDIEKSGNIAPQPVTQEIIEKKDKSIIEGTLVSENDRQVVITVYYNATNFNNITINKADIQTRKKERVKDPLITKQAQFLFNIVKNINDSKIVDAYNNSLMWQKKCALSLEQQREVIWKACPYMIFSYIPTLKTPFENNLLTLKICSQCHGKNFPCSACEDSGIISDNAYAKFVVKLMHPSEEKE